MVGSVPKNFSAFLCLHSSFTCFLNCGQLVNHGVTGLKTRCLTMVNKEPMMVGTRKKVVDDESKKYGGKMDCNL